MKRRVWKMSSLTLRTSRPLTSITTSPGWRPCDGSVPSRSVPEMVAIAAGESGMTSATCARLRARSRGAMNPTVKSRSARATFMTTPAPMTVRRFQGAAAASERGSVGSSSPIIRTKPPMGSQLIVYSVSPRRNDRPLMRGGKPMPNSSTLMRNAFAARKCPSSWMTTRGTRRAAKISAERRTSTISKAARKVTRRPPPEPPPPRSAPTGRRRRPPQGRDRALIRAAPSRLR